MMRVKGIAIAIVVLLLVAACDRFGGESGDDPPRKDYTVRLSYVEWSSEIASTNLVKAVMQEKLNYPCEIIAMSADRMWAAVASGEVDAMVSAWLPSTHDHYWEQYRNDVVDLGPNLTGAKTGLVVPNVNVGRQTDPTGKQNEPYIRARSIADLRKYAARFNNSIVGIDPGAGIMRQTRKAMKAYGLEADFELIEGGEASMTQALTQAVQEQRWIVVTGWEPHWMFGRWNLRFLDDPKNVFGGRERIHTIVRKGLEDDAPDAYAFLDRFSWTTDEMDRLMVWIQREKGLYPYRNALRWIEAQPDRVSSWLPANQAKEQR